MNRWKLKSTCLLVSVFISASALLGCSSRDDKSLQVFNNLKENTSSSSMYETVKELSSKKYEGRLTGTEENKKVEQYLADYFKSLGLESPKGADNYRQVYSQPTITMNKKPEMRVLDSGSKLVKEFNYLDNFFMIVATGLKIKGEIIAPIYHVENVDLLKKDNDKLQDKVIVLSAAVFEKVQGTSTLGDLIRNSIIKGIVCESDKTDTRQNETGYFTNLVNVPEVLNFNDNGIMLAFCDSQTFKELTMAARVDMKLQLKMDYNVELKNVSNVMGVIPGSDKKEKDEYIIVSAHFDHIGDNHNGTYNPGAFDNATGTSIMMEVARILKEKNLKPKKSIIFVGFNGEENGLLGSTFFASHAPCDLEKAVMINVDMVGHKNNGPFTFMYTAENSLLKEMESYAEVLDLDFNSIENDRSDHASLQAEDCPSVTISEWQMGEYHSPKDTADIVEQEDLKAITNLVLYYISKHSM
jgi:hypothetical protein